MDDMISAKLTCKLSKSAGVSINYIQEKDVYLLVSKNHRRKASGYKLSRTKKYKFRSPVGIST